MFQNSPLDRTGQNWTAVLCLEGKGLIELPNSTLPSLLNPFCRADLPHFRRTIFSYHFRHLPSLPRREICITTALVGYTKNLHGKRTKTSNEFTGKLAREAVVIRFVPVMTNVAVCSKPRLIFGCYVRLAVANSKRSISTGKQRSSYPTL